MVTQSQPQPLSSQQQQQEREPKSRFIIKCHPGLKRFTLRYKGWYVGTFASIDDCRQRMDLIDNVEWLATKDRHAGSKEGWGVDLAVAAVLLVVVIVAVFA